MPRKSLPYRPYHRHQRRLYLKPGEIVKVEVEIWPTSMVFKKGHRIRLDVQPRDGLGQSHYMHYHADYNSGATNTVYAGGDMASYLLLPVLRRVANRLLQRGIARFAHACCDGAMPALQFTAGYSPP